jgi:hypothetical protein
MKSSTIHNILIFLFSSILINCSDNSLKEEECLKGKIVGQKCDVFAFQLESNKLNAAEWIKKDQASGDIIDIYQNVIGLIEIPKDFQVEGKEFFVTVRRPTQDEALVSCYHDLPGPPNPLFVVTSASDKLCSEKTSPN